MNLCSIQPKMDYNKKKALTVWKLWPTKKLFNLEEL